MTLETRISQLEDRIGVANAIPPLIRIDVADNRQGSTDPGTPQLAVVPGKIGGQSGVTLLRGHDEPPTDFLKRCKEKYTDFYG